MKLRLKTLLGSSALALGLALIPSGAVYADTCTGNCGTLGANGVVTTPPVGGDYTYVSSSGGIGGVGQIDGVGGTDGSLYETSSFTANEGSVLEFYFNFVTSDGAGYADYAWAALNDGVDDLILFTARTTTSGDTVPGFSLPGLAPGVVLDPTSTPIIGGGPVWSPLGGYSGSCYNAGCGYTGWVKSTYTFDTGGMYTLKFGVTDWSDGIYDSGMAFAGAQIDDEGIGDIGTPPQGGIPEPATWLMMIMGFGMVGLVSRRRGSTLEARSA
ncbi:NF038132 family protein [Pseudokordiimonas caeni]|uniref:NF038132 family protein n=1 Tax=Pseudokordiimonas caeni TaxID=2997908 RepID=UPI002811EFE9|nr:NF038132 family protein [Pseudokordiimonas caeni]